ncbi:MAG: phosphoribosylformylglycinamidine synthase I [Chloroflexota bacterium]
MSTAKVLVMRAPGTNCDVETAFAFDEAGGTASLVHVTELLERERRLHEFDILVFPGGFIYGDDLGAGKVLANEVRLKLGPAIKEFIDKGRLVLGICNGLQVLVKMGVLPGPFGSRQQVTVTGNDSGRFECRWIHMAANTESPCIFTRGIDRLYLPVAHGEGKVVPMNGALSDAQVPLYYVDECGKKAGYPHNPNGSVGNIAGICNESGRVFALMPHPERHVSPHQHPAWTRDGAEKRGDGFEIFRNAVRCARES